ncbi:MAG: glycine cleavage system protein GcvH [Gammaproteobacteria bacterium]|nr:glycine cleavage system protein GcvH [Gammaproteobacteria bacterium]
MSSIPKDLKYTTTHEWVRKEEDGTYTVGITDHAQGLLGDMVFVDLPEVGSGVTAGDDVAVVESVKAASDVYTPLTGEIVEVNEALENAPELVNAEPYGDGWLYRIKAEDADELLELLDAASYKEELDDDADDEE